jgi:uncharacterized OB-fold protein
MSLSHDEWTDALHNGDLLGQTCSDCETTYGTPVSVCHECGGRDLETTTLPREGEIHSVTTIGVSPAGFDSPYHVGLVQLGDARITARIAGDESEPDIGSEVVLTDLIENNGDSVPVFSVE